MRKPRVQEFIARTGSRVECSCCSSTFRYFAPVRAHPDRQCWTCGSRERHRQIGLYLREHKSLLRPGMTVLHVAPEEAVRRLLPDRLEYTPGDLEPKQDQVRVDVTSMEFPDAAFDVILCNHVMEHVFEDRAAMREFFRVLKPGGWGLAMTPIVVETTYEDPAITDPEDRLREFGQRDHVRRYGWDYVDRLTEAGLDVEVVTDFSPSDVERYRLNNLQGEVEPMFIIRKP